MPLPELTSEERTLYTQRLVQAETAYHDLQIGQSARVVVDGLSAERVEFTSANSTKLYSYIMELKTKLGLLSPSNGYNAGPARFIF